MKHKHCDVICAWAQGSQIQVKMSDDEEWKDWFRQDIAPCFYPDVNYRVKPQKKQLWARPYGYVHERDHGGQKYIGVFRFEIMKKMERRRNTSQ